MSIKTAYTNSVNRLFGRLSIKHLMVLMLVFAAGSLFFIGFYAWNQMDGLSAELSKAAKGSKDINIHLSEVKSGSESAQQIASNLNIEMNQELVKMMKTNVADMHQIQKTFEDMVREMKTLIDSGEEDSIMLMLAVEDIYEKVRKESLPQVRNITEKFNTASAKGEQLANVATDLKTKASSFVEISTGALLDAEKIETRAVAASQKAYTAQKLLISVVAVVIIAFIFFALNSLIAITNPINLIVERIKDIAQGEGDLTRRLDESSNNEFGNLAHWFNTFMDKLQGLVTDIKQSAIAMSGETDTLQGVVTETAEGSRKQRIETDQVATAVNEMTATVHDVASNASQAAVTAGEADQASNNGKLIVNKTVTAIEMLAEEVDNAASVIHEVERESDNIGTVLDVIRGIAEQTNLLALNAAIEAARAGEQGRGFAVVADEVRTLAGRTQQSTQEIQDMIQKLQNGAQKAVNVMDKSKKQAIDVVSQAEEAGAALSVITAAVDNISHMNTQIANAAKEQSLVTEEINRNIVNISQVAEKTADDTQMASVASISLNDRSILLKSLVDQFKV